MKLDRGNPNLMKQKALRVNPHNTLESFSVKRKHQATTAYVPKPRDPNVVPSPAINIWEQPVYKPDTKSYVRPGANDFLNVKSRGL